MAVTEKSLLDGVLRFPEDFVYESI